MSNSKTSSAPKAAAKKPATAAAPNHPGQAQANPQAAQARRPSTIDETIAKAQHGRVNVTPAKAIEMAGQLYSRRNYAQAERVCRQIIASRPGNAAWAVSLAAGS